MLGSLKRQTGIGGDIIMEKRPNFNEIKSYHEFAKYYWYREELSQICKSIGLEYRGTKQELIYSIEQYFYRKYGRSMEKSEK